MGAATNFVLATGDTLAVTIPGAVIPAAAAPQPLLGTSTDLLRGGIPVCVKGDELPPALRGPLTYSEPSFPNFGTGTLQLTPIPGVHLTTVLADNGTAVLLKGTPFLAVFTIGTPATDPKGQPAPQAPKTGTASFATTNDWFTAD